MYHPKSTAARALTAVPLHGEFIAYFGPPAEEKLCYRKKRQGGLGRGVLCVCLTVSSMALSPYSARQ